MDEVINVNELTLTKEELNKKEEFKNEINFNDTNSIIQYGQSTQNEIAEFSDATLEKVKNKDLGEIGTSLTSLISELKGFDALDEKGLKKIFKKAQSQIDRLKTRYTKVSQNVEKVVDILDGHEVNLTRDIAVLDELFNKNEENYRNLSLYILAGKEKLEEGNKELALLKEKAEKSNDQKDAQIASDFQQMLVRLEKKIYDLDLTRTITVQTAPQIRMLQNNDSLMIEKIQTVLVNTIPLWKSQMVLALGLKNSEDALKAERMVTDATNELLKKNAEALKQSTIGVARESERGIIDIETLQETNTKLIETIDEVMNIQKEGREKRALAETELRRLENELKTKVLSTIN